MITPIPHLNGTSKDALLDQVRDAYAKVQEAITVLAEASPHPRDYYPLGPHAFTQAAKEHLSRMDRLTSVRDE